MEWEIKDINLKELGEKGICRMKGSMKFTASSRSPISQKERCVTFCCSGQLADPRLAADIEARRGSAGPQLDRARSRLYRSKILQENMRWNMRLNFSLRKFV